MGKMLFLVAWLCTLILVVQNIPLIQTVENKTMAITKSTFNFITGFEGKRHTAYKDSKGIWTTGVGHLIKADEQYLLHKVLTDQQVEDLFKDDLKWCDDAVASSVRVSLNQNQSDALYSLCFNIGEEHFKNSEVVRHLNDNDLIKAANAFMNWVTPSELTSRREKERKLFLTPV